MTSVVYGDFNCPFSYLASLRIDALVRDGLDIEFRAVEHAVDVPVVGRRLDDDGRAALAAEMREVRDLLAPGEEFCETIPQTVPNTHAAISGYAEAFGVGVAHDVRRLLFDAYWSKGLDIGSPEVLRSLLAAAIKNGASPSFTLREAGYAVSTNRGPITVGAYRRISAWRDGWRGLGTETIPVVADGDDAHIGIDALTWLAKQLDARASAPHAAA
jgi:2-hydroxychromene-2-carboxylate isomerase